jgi:hypothetical protein
MEQNISKKENGYRYWTKEENFSVISRISNLIEGPRVSVKR